MSKLDKNESCGTGNGSPQDDGYWQDVENKVLDPKALASEFKEDEFDSFSVKKTRRNFLKIMGFSVTALPLTGCIKIPVKKALPYLKKNDTVIPGVANWYASSFAGMPLLVKTREGRPIKIEGNAKSIVTHGAADAQMQASVISLYDSYRYTSPLVAGKSVEWDQFDTAFTTSLNESKASGRKIVIVTDNNSSPSEVALVNEFVKAFNGQHIIYSSTANNALALANKITHGHKTVSEYNLEEADVIVSLGADFLGTFGSTLSQSKGYSKRRNVKHTKGMSKHIQVEAVMTLTGATSDIRKTRSLRDQRNILLGLLADITGEAASGFTVTAENKELVATLAKELKGAKGNSLLLSNDTDVNAQVIVNKINMSLGNYGSTVNTYNKPYELVADDAAFEKFVVDMNGQNVGAALFLNVNPAYDYHNAKGFVNGVKKVKTTLSFASSEDETSKTCKFVAPMNHIYESWSDVQVSHNELAFAQPVIQPLFGSRMATETLMSALGKSGSFHDYMQKFWANNLFTKQAKFLTAADFWNDSVHNGVVTLNGLSKVLSGSNLNVKSQATKLNAVKYTAGLQVITYEKYAIRDGKLANNPMLQEMPDPITKATWDNYAMVSPKYAKANSIKSGDVVTLTTSNGSVSIPAIVQPGTEENTVAVALGYGRVNSGKVGKNLGGNAFVFNSFVDGNVQIGTQVATLKKTGAFRGLAQTQTHHSMEGRDIIRETTFAEYSQNNKAGNEKKAMLVNIYPEHKKEGHQWAMAIDLSSCTGCSSCIVSCNVENNVAVVGRQEVANRREMHWLRIDRYYKGDENEPEVMNMPMTCQHCENAPCENVCPVLATVHSSDGLNQQVYNRCVGTRYCANNCPYKVRRFNWFNYDMGTETERMVLNPDITVRSRGVMEKCSMCIQRIQESKLEAKRERRDLKDGDIKLGCQQSCPTDAIVFGDMKDENSKISKYLKNERNYTVLEELNVKPRVSYLTKIRNK